MEKGFGQIFAYVTAVTEIQIKTEQEKTICKYWTIDWKAMKYSGFSMDFHSMHWNVMFYFDQYEKVDVWSKKSRKSVDTKKKKKNTFPTRKKWFTVWKRNNLIDVCRNVIYHKI